MFRALLRLLSMIMLAIAVIMAVLDATRSIAVNAVVLTPLGDSWAMVSPSTLELFEQSIAGHLPGFFSDPLATGFLGLPGFAVFGVLALLLAIAGRRPVRTANRFAAQR